MALTPKQTPDQKKASQDEALLREVDDAVRQDQYASFGKQYGRPLLALLVLGLVGFGVYLWWDSRQEAAMERDSEVLVTAMDQVEGGDLERGSGTLDALLADGNGGSQAAARMLKAGIAMEQGQTAEAAKLFAQVAEDGDSPPALRDLATIREVAARFDTMPPAEVVSRLKPLAVPGNAFFGSAGELVAMAYLEQGKRAEAGALLAAIARDEDAPDTLRGRARQMAGVLGVDAIDDADEILAQQQSGGQGAAAPQPAQN